MTKVSCDKIHSRLESTLSGEGHALCIATCRADADWILELEDELGRSTLLDARSASDQAAQDAALAEIEGVGGRTACSTMCTPRHGPAKPSFLLSWVQ